MPISTVPNLHLILGYVVYLAILGGIALIMFRPFFPGLAVILGGVLLYVGYESVVARGFAGMSPVWLAIVIGLSALGLTSSWWSEKLGVRFAHMSQQVMWGAIIGSFLGILLAGVFGMLLGLIIGTFAMELRSGRKPVEAARLGLGSLLSMLGPRGFQLIMALLVSSLALQHLRGL